MKRTVSLLVFLCAGLAAFCIWQARQLGLRNQELRDARLALDHEHHARAEQDAAHTYLERREREWQEKVMQLSSLVGNLRASESTYASNYTRLAQASSNTNGGAGPNGGPGVSTDPAKAEGMFGKGMGEMVAKMMKDPAMKELMRAQQGAMVKMMYGPLINDLKLPPEQQAKLSDLLLDQQMKTLERSQGAFQDGKVDLKKMGEGAAEVQKENEATIKALLGEEKYAEFEDYKKTIGERMQLSQLQQQMKDSGSPLQDEQTKQILAVVREERERHPPVFDENALAKGGNVEAMFADGVMERQIAWQEELNRTVAGRLNGVLTPEQLKAYTEMQAQQLSMQKFGMKMAQEMFGKRASETKPDLPTPVPVSVP